MNLADLLDQANLTYYAEMFGLTIPVPDSADEIVIDEDADDEDLWDICYYKGGNNGDGPTDDAGVGVSTENVVATIFALIERNR